jgi:hypothetical protein
VITHAPKLAGQLLSIDGKSIRCTAVGGNTSAQNFACLVSVYGQQAGVVQMQLMYNAKISEIEVAKQLLTRVHQAPVLAQSLQVGFSLDALHAQVDTLSLMHAQNQHYIVGLKANQKILYQQMQHLFATALPLSQAQGETEKTHGRTVDPHRLGVCGSNNDPQPLGNRRHHARHLGQPHRHSCRSTV